VGGRGTAYYNEFDAKAAAWLRELIADGHIAPGEVDERDIRDVKPDDLRPFRQVHLFAGIGGWSAALRQAGWRDDDKPVWTASCPCQPFSAAGGRSGFTDERHLWPAVYHLATQCRPDVLLGEQVASKDGLAWIDLVSSDMEAAGYAGGALDLCSAGFGAPNIRQRLYFVWMADPGCEGRRENAGSALGHERAHGRQSHGDHELASHGAVKWMADTDSGRKTVELAGWNTPRATGGSNGGPNQTGGALPADAALAGPARLTASGELLTGSAARMEGGGQLHPAHSLWLQGYPDAWLSCGVRAMQLIRKSPQASSKR
jgi:DNA (cytosine-5)-methyltransferase 1